MGHFVCWTLYYSFSVLFFHQIRFCCLLNLSLNKSKFCDFTILRFETVWTLQKFKLHFSAVFEMQVYLCFCVFSVPRTVLRDWLGRTSPKWPILCRVGRKTLLHILLWCDFIFYCENCCRLHGHLPVYTSVSLWFVLIRWQLQRLAMQLLVNVTWCVVTVVGVVHCTAFSLLTVYRLVLLLGCDWFIINICSLISYSTFTHAVLC